MRQRNSGKVIKGLTVDVRNGNVDQALKVLSKKVNNDGKLKRYRELEHYAKPSEKRKQKKKDAVKAESKRIEKN